MSNQEFDINWGEFNEATAKKLEENKISYKVNNGDIYIKEKDLNNAQSCCS